GLRVQPLERPHADAEPGTAEVSAALEVPIGAARKLLLGGREQRVALREGHLLEEVVERVQLVLEPDDEREQSALRVLGIAGVGLLLHALVAAPRRVRG